MQVKLQNLILGQPPFQRQRHANLAQFARNFAGAAFLQQPCHLHGQGGPARDDPAVPDGLCESPRHGFQVYPAMICKTFILKRQQHGGIGRVHCRGINRQPPTPVGHGIGAQHGAVPVQHLNRSFQRQGRQNRGGNPVIAKIARRCR